MPRLTRTFIKLGLVWFVLACAAAVANQVAQGPPVVLTPSWLHALVVGWVSHLIFGVALWLFPKWSREQPHGPPWVGWTALVLLEVGLVLRVAGESFPTLGIGREALIFAAIAQWVAGVALVMLLWPRVRGR